MFREMRRKDKELAREDAIAILQEATHGTLALAGDNGYTYSLPISFAYVEDTLYFHGAASGGHKMDAIKRNPKVSFSVVSKDELLPSKFSTRFQSVIAFGEIRVLEDGEEKQRGLEFILQKYSAGFMDEGRKYIEKTWAQVAVMEMKIEHLTGKGTP